MGFSDRLMHAWNAFTREDTDPLNSFGAYGTTSYGARPDRIRYGAGGEKSIINSIYNRIGMDVAAIEMKHVRVDKEKRYLSDINSGLNECLTLEANADQGATAFRQDIAMTLFEKGVAAIVPVDTTLDPKNTGAYDILSMRVGEIVAWEPSRVRVNLYNEKTGRKEEVTLAKKNVAIIENPLYSVMNEPNSTLQRLIRKLSLLDTIDEQAGSGKLDLIIQLPYVIKSDARRSQAEQRRKDIEMQLKGSQYGIAYTDGTERITQLNRPAENNMLAQIEKLEAMLYAQMGLTEEVFNGTASEAVMLNYQQRTLKPILKAITEGMKRAFLTKTARTQGQSIEFFVDPFDLVPVSSIADIADKFIRNKILTGNEMRSIIGRKPVTDDPSADMLNNPNMPDQPSDAGASLIEDSNAPAPPIDMNATLG